MTAIDTSEVQALAVDLGKASGAVMKEADQVLERGALGVKQAMVEDAEARHSGFARHFPRSISYDQDGLLSYVIGPDKGRTQGALGNLLYFGSSNNGPTLDIEAGLIAEEPELVSEMGKMLERVVGGA